MDCTAKGVGFTAAEIRALLRFASKEDSEKNKRGVKVVVAGDRVWARATNGTNSLELTGASDGKLKDGEWFVSRDFLEFAVKMVVGVKALVRLCFKGASLHRAFKEENNKESGAIEVPDDAAIADISFPWEKAALRTPPKDREIAPCSALPGEYSALLAIVEDALDVEYTDLHPPADTETPWIFVIANKGPTSARGTLKAAKSAASAGGDDGDGEGDGEGAKGGKKKAGRGQRQLELA
jgi:hypothetical protein